MDRCLRGENGGLRHCADENPAAWGVHDAGHLAYVADELNHRPRKTLGWQTPPERLATLIAIAT
jgi:hypothetical protein